MNFHNFHLNNKTELIMKILRNLSKVLFVVMFATVLVFAANDVADKSDKCGSACKEQVTQEGKECKSAEKQESMEKECNSSCKEKASKQECKSECKEAMSEKQCKSDCKQLKSESKQECKGAACEEHKSSDAKHGHKGQVKHSKMNK